MARYLVVAASSAIGQSLTTLLKKQGDTVLTTARNNHKISPDFQLDATDFDAVLEVFLQAGSLDGVVNCAGSLFLKNAHSTSAGEFQAVINASLTTSFATIRAAGLTMKQGGSVVLISSAAALVGLANHEAIAAAKAGIIGLAQSAAATYAANNLRVNVVAPGMVESPLTSSLLNNQLVFNASKAMHALGRIGTPEDIAHAILFLLNPDNGWITGQVLAVDGGLSRIRPKMKM
ncbi:SDR family NAD(P)-dependent oxidoreductase [Legionella pneumophila]|uniref:2-deoxy-D-gluconate 3-dehydrogenase n=1 Tax=Legionella pneumophila subsp. pascullei TaxID=91890 RepID=A0AAX2IW69_LEGPN|nr:SDR family oxidoreductase [Legionella pneumophila]AMP88377.1 2-deoxy-D-gluconate 3-dehydrogenase [Legionella pneumophila subsp. pascullei]AMP91286.1 2-deoxy-D-gluconate 3-dehydrogenase [Legionella pneumophila subsp. pascullei]AMP94274.1 2-deoxy-D-gluconate 3-dehydrogenase [Legionella pneumophila subsp. pascullei]SQG89059.1 2-deoxy-D-gluconate 3-dehydrogenase [Legionella pneumophila subsp. pascullei]VEH04109.1 2-deoxy-D-gluconate 3-dehydrogenase [Legionella pneumophila subsp. pascullei]